MVRATQALTNSATDAQLTVFRSGSPDVGTVKTISDARGDREFKVVGPNRSNPDRLAAALTLILQRDGVDSRLLIADLPADEPDKTIDPNMPRRFWADAAYQPTFGTVNTPVYVLSRDVTIVVDWDGTNYFFRQEVVR